MAFRGFFNQSSPAGSLIASAAVSIPFATALNYNDHCKRHNETMSFSNYLTFSVSLIRATVGHKGTMLPNDPKKSEMKESPKLSLDKVASYSTFFKQMFGEDSQITERELQQALLNPETQKSVQESIQSQVLKDRRSLLDRTLAAAEHDDKYSPY